jgi:hypothetical protein
MMAYQAAPMTEQRLRLKRSGMDLGTPFDLAASRVSVGPGPPNQTLAQGRQYVLIIGSEFGRRPE